MIINHFKTHLARLSVFYRSKDCPHQFSRLTGVTAHTKLKHQNVFINFKRSVPKCVNGLHYEI